jgi:hypothetical protein
MYGPGNGSEIATLDLTPSSNMNTFVHFLLRSLDCPEKGCVCIPRGLPACNYVVKYFPDYLLVMSTTKCLQMFRAFISRAKDCQ